MNPMNHPTTAPVTLPEFAALCGCQPEDVEFLIASKRLIVTGARIDPELKWLAQMKLQGCGRMTPGGQYIPAGQRPKGRPRAAPRRRAM